MRIDRLDLIRYGRFTDWTLVLARREHDMHIVYGPNEAGKTTLGQGIVELLYGIHPRTELDFLHRMQELRIGARLSRGEAHLDVVRRKGNRSTLCTPDGTALRDDALDPFLVRCDKAFFVEMFGLDRDRLAKGAKAMLEYGNDVGQVLFQSASGLERLGERRRRLEAEKERLWGPRAKSARRYDQARQRFEAAHAEKRRAIVSAQAHDALHERVATLQAECDALTRDRLLAQTKISLLERIRRVRPTLATLARLNVESERAGELPALPQDAAQRVARAGEELALADAQRQLLESQLRERDERLAQLPSDTEAVAAAAEIRALEEKRLELAQAPARIERHRAQTDRLLQDAAREALALGHSDRSEESLRALVLPAHVRAPLHALLHEGETLRQAADLADKELDARRAEAEALRKLLASMPRAASAAGLRAALERARSLGDVRSRHRSLASACDEARQEAGRALAALGPHRTAVDRSREPHGPAPASIRALHARTADLGHDFERASLTLAEREASARRAALEVEAHRAAREPLDREALARVRAHRDGLWQSLKADPATLEGRAEAYEAAVEAADRCADRRFDEAAHQAELRALERAARDADEQQDAARREAARLRSLRDTMRAEYERLLEREQLPEIELAELADWLEARNRAHQAHLRLVRAESELDTYEHDIAGALASLTAALADTVPATGADSTALSGGSQTERVQTAISIAETVVERIQRNETERQLSHARLAELEQTLARLGAIQRHAAAALDDWQRRWQDVLAAHDAPRTALPLAQWRARLQSLADIELKLDAITRLREEDLAPLQDDLQRFHAAAIALASRLSIGFPTDESPHAQAEAITAAAHRRLVLAERADAERRAQEVERTACAERLEMALARALAARSSIESLCAAAGTQDLATLAAIIDRVEESRRITNERREVLERLERDGDGRSITQLEREVASVSEEDALAQPHALAEAVRQATQEAEKLAGELAIARAELEAIGGRDAAAVAEASREEAVADMVGAIERYAHLEIATRLVRWTMDRYRERNEGPLLARASGIFDRLTLGAFEGLQVDYSEEPVQLVGKRAGGQGLVAPDAMSEGTRDQMYFALRIAALHLHLDHEPPMPFIADDLFITFDDERALAGLRELFALSTRTQVIFLTHHEHLLDLARAAFGQEIGLFDTRRDPL